MQTTIPGLLKTPAVLDILGYGRTKHFEEVKEQAFVPPVCPGERPALYPRHEVELLAQARIAGLGKEDRQALVREMKARRGYPDHQQAVEELREFFAGLVSARKAQ